MRNKKLGIIWNILYINTDLSEDGLRILAEQILDALEEEKKDENLQN